MFLWATGVYGLSGPCCCPMEFSSLMECVDESFGPSGHHPCKHEDSGSHHSGNGCFSLRCAGELTSLGLPEFESLLAEHQLSAFPIRLADPEKVPQTPRSINGQTCSLQEKPIDPLLQSCSLLC
jgi:hypothetical protein